MFFLQERTVGHTQTLHTCYTLPRDIKMVDVLVDGFAFQLRVKKAPPAARVAQSLFVETNWNAAPRPLQRRPEPAYNRKLGTMVVRAVSASAVHRRKNVRQLWNALRRMARLEHVSIQLVHWVDFVINRILAPQIGA